MDLQAKSYSSIVFELDFDKMLNVMLQVAT